MYLNQKFKFLLPELEYSYSCLEPYIDSDTMKIHHTKHHQKYIDELNLAIEKYPELQDKSLIELLNDNILPEDIRTTVRNNGGGHFNHTFFWTILTPKKCEPSAQLKEKIIKDFGSFENFKNLFENAAKSRFASGWAWLSLDKNKNLVVSSTANQDCPIKEDLLPILGLDVWEHAYYLKYQNRRVDYISAFWNIINWPKVQEYYLQAIQAGK